MNKLEVEEKEELLRILKKNISFDIIFLSLFLIFFYYSIRVIYGIIKFKPDIDILFFLMSIPIFLAVLVLFNSFIYNNLKFYKVIRKVKNDEYILKNVLIKDVKLDISYTRVSNGSAKIKIVKLIVCIENINEEYNPFPNNFYNLKYDIKTVCNKEVLYQDIIDGKCSKKCKLIFVEGFNGPDVFYFTSGY